MGVGVMVELKVEDIASSIKKLDKADKETLLLLLSDKGKEIAKRVKDIKTKKVKPMTREEIFQDVL
ncbi:MAG: hypothetical protein QMD01_04805 [Thermodesulfovibrionales bacterium]|nr:hypothetical protein [Thermodesulfovibrionales bacterium]